MANAAPARPLRVLQLVAMLHNGGAERWVIDICTQGRLLNIHSDVAVVWEQNGLFAERAKQRGIRVFHCGAGGQPLKFVRRLRRILHENGPYDAIHCHIHAYSGFAVLAARMEGVPVRIAHSHNVVGHATADSLARRLYIRVARALLRAFATQGLGPSAAATEDLFGPGWRREPRWHVHPCGIDLSPFHEQIGDGSTREALGIPRAWIVLGSVGRLTGEKNSVFLVDVLTAALRVRDNLCLLLVGEGPLREQIEQRAREAGCRDRLFLPGIRHDVPALMRDAMDVFVFPSPPPPYGNEALPFAVVEAQAAGLPCVVSDGVAPEAFLIPGLMAQVRADAGPEAWAEAVVRQIRRRDPAAACAALATIEATDHNSNVNMRRLSGMYTGNPPAAGVRD